MILTSVEIEVVNEALRNLHQRKIPNSIPSIQEFVDELVEGVDSLFTKEDLEEEVGERTCPWCKSK